MIYGAALLFITFLWGMFAYRLWRYSKDELAKDPDDQGKKSLMALAVLIMLIYLIGASVVIPHALDRFERTLLSSCLVQN